MVRRQSELFLPTLRDDPADAEAISHKLLARAGLIRQVSAGLWSFLPAGWKTHEKIVQVIREEMDGIGGQEMLMPVLAPAELWEKTGRIRIPELFRLQDRGGRDFVLSMTHEETVTFHFSELGSYRDLPKSLYHFQTKGRDEPRPRGGLLRVREFIMKDSYSFDRDEAGLDVSFQKHKGAYDRIFERCGIEAVAVQAESGMMGGSESIDYLAPSGSGENTLVTCENGDYAADLEIARGVPRAPEFPESLDKPLEVATPGIATIEELAGFLGIDAAATSKAMPVTKDDGTRRARPDPRRRPARGGQARGGAGQRVPPCDRGDQQELYEVDYRAITISLERARERCARAQPVARPARGRSAHRRAQGREPERARAGRVRPRPAARPARGRRAHRRARRRQRRCARAGGLRARPDARQAVRAPHSPP